MFFIGHNFDDNYETHVSGNRIGGGDFFCRAAAVSDK